MSKAFLYGTGGTGGGKPEDERAVDLDMAAGDQEIMANPGTTMSKVTIKKPATLVSGNIKENVNIAGIIGDFKGYSEDTDDDEHLVRVLDFDGTILKEEILKEGDIFTLPEPPDHEDDEELVFHSWSSPVEIIDGTIVMPDNDVNIRAGYKTVGDVMKIYVSFTASTTTITIPTTLVLSGHPCTFYWGDGTSNVNTVAASGQSLSHSYKAGDYVIRIEPTSSINCKLRISTASSVYIFGSASLNSAIRKVYISNRIVDSTTTSPRFSDYLFQKCTNLETVVMPPDLEIISTRAFDSCSMLKNIAIPAKSKTIGNYAFFGCSNLSDIVIPASVTTVNTYAFQNCTSLKSVIVPKAGVGDSAFINCTGLKKVYVMYPLNNASAFSGCNSLKRVVLGSGCSIVGASAFSSCTGLTTVIKKGNAGDYSYSIAASAFLNCVSLKHFTDEIFSTKTNKIHFASAHTPTSAFQNCCSLEFVELMGNFSSTAAGTGGYLGCCYLLKKVKIAKTFTTIPAQAFISNYSVIEYDLTDYDMVPTLSAVTAFTGISTDCVMKVKESLLSEFKAKTNWTTYAKYMVGVPDEEAT